VSSAWLFATYLLVALAVGLYAREYVRALVAVRLGDPSPRQFGWVRLDPRGRIDPIGSVILPLAIFVLWGSLAARPPPVAYAKPMPFEPNMLRNRGRDETLVALAGPLTNLAIATLAGLLLRAGLTGEVGSVAFAFLYTNVVMFVFHLMPIPGLDGARLLARVLPPRAAEVYRNLDQYLVLFVLAVFFLIGGPLLGIVNGLANLVCRAVAGDNCV
jgi:Zn-dependent protease